MTDHRAEAEQLLAQAAREFIHPDGDPTHALAAAQVHATLALADAIGLQEEEPTVVGRRYRITDEHLQEVVEVYSRAAKKAEPPTRAVAIHFNVPHSTAANWLVHARKRSLLRRWTVNDSIRSGLRKAATS